MDFNERLEKAIERGRRAGDAASQAAARQAITEEELRRLHSQYRLELSEHIELACGRCPIIFLAFATKPLSAIAAGERRSVATMPAARRAMPASASSRGWK